MSASPTGHDNIDFTLSSAAITGGNDGALWYLGFYVSDNGVIEQDAKTAAKKLGRLTTGNVLTEIAIPASFESNAFTLGVGPDGGVWFTEVTKIGRYLPY